MSESSDDTKTILLVDDEEGFTRLLKMNLERHGRYRVHCEHDSSRVLDVARSMKPDVILLDVVMPGLDGGELAKRIKEDETLADTPVVMVTALVDNRDTGGKARVTEEGQVLIGKPVNLDALQRCLDEMIGG